MKRTSLGTYLFISLIAGAFLGVIFYFGTSNVQTAVVAGGITVIVSLVVIATLELTVKDEGNATEPRLK